MTRITFDTLIRESERVRKGEAILFIYRIPDDVIKCGSIYLNLC